MLNLANRERTASSTHLSIVSLDHIPLGSADLILCVFSYRQPVNAFSTWSATAGKFFFFFRLLCHGEQCTGHVYDTRHRLVI